MKIINTEVLDRYIRLILDCYFPEVVTYKNRYNFRCNVCGDSKKRVSKKRAWILKDRSPWVFYCHNCNTSMSAEHWIRTYFSSYYNMYTKEVYKLDLGLGTKLSEINSVLKKQSLRAQEYCEMDDMKYFVPLYRNAEDERVVTMQLRAREYCIQRKIPIEIRKKWYVATGGRFRNRLVMPYYDNEGKIYSYQCRSLNGLEPKYMTRVNSKNNVYNYFNVDKNKPVIVLEGLIDSLFVDNSIAVSGLKIHDVRLESINNRYFLLDNDDSGKRNCITLLSEGERVFLWNKYLKFLNLLDKSIKDINELILFIDKKEKFTFEELNPFFSNNRLDEVFLTR